VSSSSFRTSLPDALNQSCLCPSGAGAGAAMDSVT